MSYVLVTEGSPAFCKALVAGMKDGEIWLEEALPFLEITTHEYKF
jgi:hypothetical protein